MRTLSMFNTISLDGYFTDAKGDMSWAHASSPDPEWDKFVSGNASGDGTLLFGRVTYEMMASYWPSPAARQSMPTVAKGMNESRKIVFSRTLKDVAWQNTRLVSEDIESAVRALKAEDGRNMTILGSGTIVAQLSKARLIDEYHLVVKPVILGAGRSLFEGDTDRLTLKRQGEKTFDNGNVVLTYSLA
jgi:dihydrofolate reductase